MLIVNERCKAAVINSPFDSLTKSRSHDKIDPAAVELKCSAFFQNVVSMSLLGDLHSRPFLLEPYVYFLICAFRNLEDVLVKKMMLRYLSLPIWESLSQVRLNTELQKSIQLQKFWNKYISKRKSVEANATTAVSVVSISEEVVTPKSVKKAKKSTKKDVQAVEVSDNSTKIEPSAPSKENLVVLETMKRDAEWFPSLVRQFIDIVCSEQKSTPETYIILYLERFVEFLVDLLSQVPTRKFLRTLLDDMHFLLLCGRSSIVTSQEHPLLAKLLTSLDNYMHFELDDQSGKALTWQEMMEESNARVQKLQQIAYSDYSEMLQDLVFSSVGELMKKESLNKHLQYLNDDQLLALAIKLQIVTEKDASNEVFRTREDVLELFYEKFVTRPRQLSELSKLPLYPTEELLWDDNQPASK